MTSSIHISDSLVFGRSWSTPELARLFSEKTRIGGWIEIMATLAAVQAEFGLISAEAATDIQTTCKALRIDAEFLAEVTDDFAKTNHSLTGVIKAVARRCSGAGAEWVCFGATVQDITDTHTCRTLIHVLDLFVQRLKTIEKALAALAVQHRDTVMCGRTHGQIGLPITFGFKAAGWVDEMDRHRQRLIQLAPRLRVGQLAGGVGSLSSFGERALELQRRFCEKLNLSAPTISWTTSRDRFAEWVNCLALITATGDRIGHEIYNLQRPEIGEVSEGFISGTIGSITMPQKRNPEIAEHLGTLSRTVRHHAAHMMENLVHDHERDGRSWKAEWLIIPEASILTDKALCLLQELVPNLQINSQRMEHHLRSTHALVHAEAVMLHLARSLGKQSAHRIVYRCAMQAVEQRIAFKQALLADETVASHLTKRDLDRLFSLEHASGHCGTLVDSVLERLDLE